MRRDLIASIVATLAFTVLLGIAYPLIVTGIAQVAMHDKAGGSLVERDGKVVGSRLVAQSFEGDDASFQPRPSQTGYAANASGFANLGPNQQDLADLTRERLEEYVAREGEHLDSLDESDVPVDAVTNSASGIDPHISRANARIQAHRIADERDADIDEVYDLIDANVDGRAFALFGEPGVNVLELNLDLDRKYPTR